MFSLLYFLCFALLCFRCFADCSDHSDCTARSCYEATCYDGICEYDPCADPTPFCSYGGCVECKLDAHCGPHGVCTPDGECVTPDDAIQDTNQVCTQDDQCDLKKPYCLQGQCVECQSVSDCSGFTPTCDTTTGQCTACITNDDCTPSLPICLHTGQCSMCTLDLDCSKFAGSTPYCNVNSGSCVECLSDSQCIPFDSCTNASCEPSYTCSGSEVSDCEDNSVCVEDECLFQTTISMAGPKQGPLTLIPGGEFISGFSIHAPMGTVLYLGQSHAILQGTCQCDGTDSDCSPGSVGISCYSAYTRIQLNFLKKDLWIPSEDPEDDRTCLIVCKIPPTLCSINPKRRAGGSVFVVTTSTNPCVFGADVQLVSGSPNVTVQVKAHYGNQCGTPWGGAVDFSFT